MLVTRLLPTAKRAAFVASGISAITLLGLAGFAPHAALGALEILAAPVVLLLEYGLTDAWPVWFFWIASAILVYAWTWLWVFLGCALVESTRRGK